MCRKHASGSVHGAPGQHMPVHPEHMPAHAILMPEASSRAQHGCCLNLASVGRVHPPGHCGSCLQLFLSSCCQVVVLLLSQSGMVCAQESGEGFAQ